METKNSIHNDLIRDTHALLAAGRPREVVQRLRSARHSSPEVGNLYGAALIRSGDYAAAVDEYRRLCVSDDGVTLRPGVSTPILVNYAIALVRAGNITGGISVLRDMPGKQEPIARQVRDAVVNWRRTLPWWRRLLLSWYGIAPGIPVPVDAVLDTPPPPNQRRPAA